MDCEKKSIKRSRHAAPPAAPGTSLHETSSIQTHTSPESSASHHIPAPTKAKVHCCVMQRAASPWCSGILACNIWKGLCICASCLWADPCHNHATALKHETSCPLSGARWLGYWHVGWSVLTAKQSQLSMSCAACYDAEPQHVWWKEWK